MCKFLGQPEAKLKAYNPVALLSKKKQSFPIMHLRPSLGKKVFPVCQVAPKNASREVGIFFVFPNFIFYKLNVQGGGGG